MTPNKIQDDKSSYDATTPKQYDKDNGGLISFVGDDVDCWVFHGVVFFCGVVRFWFAASLRSSQ